MWNRFYHHHTSCTFYSKAARFIPFKLETERAFFINLNTEEKHLVHTDKDFSNEIAHPYYSTLMARGDNFSDMTRDFHQCSVLPSLLGRQASITRYLKKVSKKKYKQTDKRELEEWLQGENNSKISVNENISSHPWKRECFGKESTIENKWNEVLKNEVLKQTME